jgi:hypothetical protein
VVEHACTIAGAASSLSLVSVVETSFATMSLMCTGKAQYPRTVRLFGGTGVLTGRRALAGALTESAASAPSATATAESVA